MITVIGSINLDLIAKVSRLPAPGETVPGDRFATAPGGKGANQALAARRAGAEVRLVGAVGRDAFAAEATAMLIEAGVDLSAVQRVDTATGVALILVGGDGENMIAVIAGANATVLPEAAAATALHRDQIVLLQHEIPLAAVDAALDAARRAGATSILNTAPYRPEADVLLGKADYVVANETEFDLYADALSLDGVGREARMRHLAEVSGRAIIVTLGSEGVLSAKDGALFHVPAMKIEPVDSVGAGDTFCGYLAQGLEAGLSLEHAVRRAGVAGSLACLTPGAQPAIPTAAEVEEALRSLPERA